MFQNEVTEMNRKFKMVVHQIDQLKEETAARDTQLLKDQHGMKLTLSTYVHVVIWFRLDSATDSWSQRYYWKIHK